MLEIAQGNPTDGIRMVAALAGRDLGGPVNRKRARRLMREHALLQRRRSEGRRRRPGFFRVEALDIRCRAAEASAVIDQAVAERDIGPGELTLGTE